MTLKDFYSNSVFYVKPSIYDVVNDVVLDYEYDSGSYHWFDFREVVGIVVGTNSITIQIKGVKE